MLPPSGLGFYVVEISTVTERIHRMSRSTTGSYLRRLDDISPSVISILVDFGSVFVVDRNDVTLQVGLQIIDITVFRETLVSVVSGKYADSNRLSGYVVVVTNILQNRGRFIRRTTNHLAVDLTAPTENRFTNTRWGLEN